MAYLTKSKTTAPLRLRFCRISMLLSQARTHCHRRSSARDVGHGRRQPRLLAQDVVEQELIDLAVVQYRVDAIGSSGRRLHAEFAGVGDVSRLGALPPNPRDLALSFSRMDAFP